MERTSGWAGGWIGGRAGGWVGGWIGRALVAVVAGVLLLSSGAEAWAGKRSRGSKYVKMKIEKVGQLRGSYVVLLKDAAGTTVVPIWIGAREAQAIQMGMKNITPSRPLTHNLLVTVLTKLKAKVHRVMVVALKNKVFIGRLVLKDAKGKKHSIDARPSDLCVLASMKKLRIYVARSVIKATGIKSPKPKQPPGSRPNHI